MIASAIAGSSSPRQRGERLSVAHVGSVLAQSYDELLAVEQSQVAVGHRGALLDVGQGADQLREEVEPHAADVEILHRAHGLHAEIILRRDFHFAQQIVFTTGFARKSDFRKVHDRYVFIKGTQKRGGVQAESGAVR